MKTLWQHFKEAPLWGKALVILLLGLGLFLLVLNIIRWSDERLDRRTNRELSKPIPVDSDLVKVIDSATVVLKTNKAEITTLKVQQDSLTTKTHELENRTAAAMATLDSIKSVYKLK